MSKVKKRKSKLIKHRTLTGYLFLLPNLIGYLLFIAFPIVYSFFLSFTKWDAITPLQFVGLKNYIKLFKDTGFLISLKNTFYYMAVSVPMMVGAGLFLAIALNRKILLKKLFNTVFFLPNITSLVAVSIVWRALYHPTMGPINMMLKSFGVKNLPGWVSSVDWAMPSVILMSIWLNAGYYMIIYSAALQSIPDSLYEAAEIDGINGVQKFYWITFPLLSPTTFFATIIALINSFKVFAQIKLMTNGGPGRATNVLGFFIYQTGFTTFRFGYASAAAYILFLILLVLTSIQYRAQKSIF
jgi:multiple sugar transport system permease protein